MTVLRLLAPGLLVAFLAVAGPASAEEVNLKFIAKNEGADFWFEVEGYPGRNPTIVVQPGDVVHAELVNEGTADHNLHFGAPIDAASDFVAPGGAASSVEFTVPEGFSGSLDYVCDPHLSLRMVGKLTTVTQSTSTNEVGAGGNEDTTPWGVLLGIPAGLGLVYVLGLFLIYSDRGRVS